jgi:signal transduction histidine kinase
MTTADASMGTTMLNSLLKIIDWFIPAPLRVSTATLWRARIFVISHLLGPCSAILILGYLYRVLAVHDVVFWSICVLCGAFWLLPIGLKLTRALTWLALFSFCDLTFVSVLGSFFYGGVSSPFLPWFLTALLIGFFYLGDRALLVLGIFAAHLAAFCAAYVLNGSFPERVPIADLSTVGVMSVLCATLYSSMMAIYYAYVMIDESALRLEIEKHLVTAAKLREAKVEAERADEAKAVFLAKMNHQLRTPLNAIIGYSEILLEDIEPNTNSADEADLRTINSAGRHLLSLVSDVLYMPKIESDNVEISVRPVDVAQCIDEVASTCRNLVSQNGNKFILEKSSDLGVIETDETRLRQILINLLGNAGKFTKDGEIVLRASRVKTATVAEIVISVEDTGIGIAAEAITNLFTSFNHANSVTSKSYGGSGLGLAVSQRLARLLSGDIAVESQPGRGSVFTVRLPAFSPSIAAAA